MHFDPLPAQCLVDQVLAIRLRGLAPGAAARLSLRNGWPDGSAYFSQATFEADADGVVDLERDAPLAGTYTGVDAMGLFWSRAPFASAAAAGCGEMPADAQVAILAAESPGQPGVSHAIRRFYRGEGVTVRALQVPGLVGSFFTPAGAGPHAAVLVVGGSDGGIAGSLQMAGLLASHGFAALALGYFACEGLPATLDRIPLEYFETATRWLAAQPQVDPRRIGVQGRSRGGELALLLGAMFPVFRAVVAYVPSGIAWGAYPPTGHAAWTWHGQAIPYANTMADAERGAIAVERIQGPVLLVSGEDDGLWPSAELAQLAVRRLQARGFSHRVEHLRYANAGHNIGWPNGPTTVLKMRHPTSGEELALGGTPEGTARAQRDSWPRMLAFLHAALAPTPT